MSRWSLNSWVFPGDCARVIDHRVAISHACAFSQLRPRLPTRYRDLQFHIAATERSRITTLTLRADGSSVEHQIPSLGLVLRGRTETPDEDEAMLVEAGVARVFHPGSSLDEIAAYIRSVVPALREARSAAWRTHA